MGNIVLLDDLTINKIAAGEVIERPASVVKELVENSIDAGATNINIEIKNGGISYIRVTDNGKGLLPDDMEIAFERHATSKIRSAEDLEKVKSMGFRGEALASIAAIANVEMKSKTMDNQTGYEIVVKGGDIISKQEVGCPNGTTITIENLFFNTPVRYKFLKKDFTEAGYIEDIITRIALINPQIAIKLINSGKTIIQTSGNGDLIGVIYNIYGKDVAENILDVKYEYEDIKITGVIGKPSIARSNRSNQLFFVNKRYIKDKTLTSSAEQGFKGMLTIGKYGFLILNLEINPQKVDVNVHPAKLEVRFEEESKVFKAVYHSIKDTLLKNDLVKNTEKNYFTEGTIEKENTTTLFNRMLEKGSKKEESINNKNIIEQIYNNKRELPNKEQYTNNFNNIIGKMAEIKKGIETYKEEQGIKTIEIPKKEENKIKNDIKLQDEQNNGNNEIEDTVKLNLPIENNQDTIVITPEIKEELAQKLQDGETQVVDISSIIEKDKEINLNNKETEEKPELSDIVKQNNNEYVKQDFDNMYTNIFGRTPIEKKIEEEPKEYILEDAKITTGENISVFENKEEFPIPSYKFIGIAFSTYIILELNKELYILDQHAAHERIMYEKVKENYYSDENKDSQLMLLPDIITLTHKEMDIAKENIEMFEKAGFMLEEFGENTIKLTGVPNICLDLDTKELFLETLDEINTVARTAKQEIEEKFIATVACKAAVKANMALTKEEVEKLMDKLLLLPNPFTCPHGRPTAIRMTKTDIEKKFSRR